MAALPDSTMTTQQTTQRKPTRHVVAHGDVWHLGEVILVCCTKDEIDWYRAYDRLVEGQMMALSPERAGHMAWLIEQWELRTGQDATLLDCRGDRLADGAKPQAPITPITPTPTPAAAAVADDDEAATSAPEPEPGTTGALSPWIRNPHNVEPGDVWKIAGHRVHVGPTRHHVLAALPIIEGLEDIYGQVAERVRRMARIRGLAEDPHPAAASQPDD